MKDRLKLTLLLLWFIATVVLALPLMFLLVWVSPAKFLLTTYRLAKKFTDPIDKGAEAEAVEEEYERIFGKPTGERAHHP